MRDIKWICFFVFLVGGIVAQNDSALVKNARSKTLKRMGKSALKQNDPSSAIIFFEAYLKRDTADAHIMSELAKAYLEIRDYDRAQRMFLRAYRSNHVKAPEALYFHALMQKSNMQYDSAKINFQIFKKEYKGSDKLLKRQASREIVFCDSVQKLMVNEKKIVVMHLDSTINKVNAEGGPVNVDDNTLVFTSLRTDKREYIIEDDTASGIKKKLYYAERTGETWQFKGEFGTNLNDAAFNTGNACFTADRKRLYFTRCKQNLMEQMICAIYVTERDENGNWSEPFKLPKPVNHPKYSSTMPTVTRDPIKGNDILFYVSNHKSGKGGLDIWYTVYDKKTKTYKVPRNAGTKINTSQNEITPYFDNETRSLYFSSNCWGGLGGYDIYQSKGDGKKWAISENIGQPLNTGADDIYYTISTNRQEGFLVSNRKGGNTLKNNTCCDDIYYYKYSEYIRILLSGNVNSLLDPDVSISKATVEIFIYDKKTPGKYLVKTLLTDSLGNYKTSLEAGQDYFIVVKKEDFLGTSEELSTREISNSTELKQDLHMLKKPKEAIHIPNVLYEFDKSKVMESSKLSLDTTVLRLMEANPELIIEIQSHTDSKGSDSYNLKLSQKRAEAVVEYLISKGITPDRLKAGGYGESKPIAPNENPDGSDNTAGRAKNRRTDFKIIGVVDAEIDNEADKE